MIVIYIDGGGNAVKLSPKHVYQGSNQTGVTVFAPVPTTTAMGIAFKLPDGTSTPYYPMTFIQTVEGLTQYEFTIPSSITQKAGQASIALQALYSDGQQTSQLIDFEIEPSVVILPDEPTPDVYDLLRQAIANNASDISDNTAAIEENSLAIQNNADNISKNFEAIKENSASIADNTADIKALQGQISNIEQLADSAQEASANAVDTAEEAKRTADGLADSIAQANENASQAVETANNAEHTANGLADSVAQANKTASNAVTTADNAVQDIAEYKNQINSDVEGLRQDIEEKQFFKGMFNSVEDLKQTYPTATENDYAYIIAGNQWIYTNGEWTDSGEPTPNTAVPASDTTPLMDGAGSAGTESQYARGDHRHPSDTNKVNKNGDTMTGSLTAPSLTGQNGVYDGSNRVYSPGNKPSPADIGAAIPSGTYPDMTVGKATNDGNGNNISDTYMPKSGGTFTGDITVPKVTGKNGVYDGSERVWSAINPPKIKQYVANGESTNNPFSYDMVEDYYQSSDGNTWWRTWTSGWKEMGAKLEYHSNGHVYTLPTSFTTTKYIVNISFGGTGYRDQSPSVSIVDKGQIKVQHNSSNNNGITFNIYACGY